MEKKPATLWVTLYFVVPTGAKRVSGMKTIIKRTVNGGKGIKMVSGKMRGQDTQKVDVITVAVLES